MDWSNQTSLSSLGSDGDQGEDELDCQHKSSAPFLPRWLPKSVVVALHYIWCDGRRQCELRPGFPVRLLSLIGWGSLYTYRLLWDPSKDNSSFAPGLGSRLVLSDTWVPTMRWEDMESRDGRRDERNILSRLGSSYVSVLETVTGLLTESATSAGTERSNIKYPLLPSQPETILWLCVD